MDDKQAREIESQISGLVMTYFGHRAEAAVHNEANQLVVEEIDGLLSRLGLMKLVVDLGFDTKVTVSRKISNRTTLDKKGLAEEIEVKPTDIKTAYDIADLTERGTLSANIVNKYTNTKSKSGIKIKKKKPKKSKG